MDWRTKGFTPSSWFDGQSIYAECLLLWAKFVLQNTTSFDSPEPKEPTLAETSVENATIKETQAVKYHIFIEIFWN